LLVGRNALVAQLTLSDHVRSFYAVDGGLGGMEGLEAHHGVGDFLDEAVVLLNNVVQVFDLEYVDKACPAKEQQQEVDIFQAGIIGAALVHHHLVRKPVGVDGVLEKGRGGGFVTVFKQHEIKGVAEFVDGTVQKHPLALDLDVGFIHPPRGRPRPFELLGFCGYEGGILNNSMVKCGVVYNNPALRHDLLQVPIRDTVPHIKKYRIESDIFWEMFAFKTYHL
jgi:hypothetical protein